MRLQSYLARCGVASRRKSVTIIQSGQVRVNGKGVTEPGAAIDPVRDRITLSGREIQLEETAHFVFHKPVNVVTSARDPQGRKTVVDFFDSVGKRVFPVGRLDRNTTGLLLVTNDGDFAQHLAHPRHGFKKTYEVSLSRSLRRQELSRFQKGIRLDEGTTAPCEIRPEGKRGRHYLYRVVLGEGRNRQIRRMMETMKARVTRLHRSHVGPLGLGSLKPGQFRKLTPGEIRLLRQQAL